MAQAVEDIRPHIVRGAEGVELDTEMLAVDTEIPLLDLPQRVRSPAMNDEARDPVRRRELFVNWIEGRIAGGHEPPVSATSVCVEEPALRDLTLLIADGKEVSEGKLLPASRPLMDELRVTLATWSGIALASKRGFREGAAHLKGVKFGLRSMSGPDGQYYERRGGTLNMYRDYAARFECSLVEGRRLLDLYGWRLADRRSRWWLYEVGGPLEYELALWLADQAQASGNKNLLERAREICPSAFDDKADEAPTKRRNR